MTFALGHRFTFVCSIIAFCSSTAWGGERWNLESARLALAPNVSPNGGSRLAVIQSKNEAMHPANSVFLIEADTGLVFMSANLTKEIERLAIHVDDDQNPSMLFITDGASFSDEALLILPIAKFGFDDQSGKLTFESADAMIAPALAKALGDPGLAGMSIGGLRGTAFSADGPTAAAVEVGAGYDVADAESAEAGEVRGGNNGTDCWNVGEPLIGPDVIVGDLIDITNYGISFGIKAYAVGTTSCNIGSSNLLWFDDTPNVPVIGQNMFRLKNGRFEQIGQGWLKYAFTALTQNACGCGCNGQGGTVLGVGCSDPYCCGLNGEQSDLGPKYEVNPVTGAHPGLPANPSYTGTIARRLQVPTFDVDPTLNAGALYFVEGQYVTPDDAAAGNQLNNASYRPINISPGTFNASLAGSTQRGKPGIRAWKDNDPLVSEAEVVVPSDGKLILAHKVTDLGNGFWHYEYALQNLNSDRSVGSFSIPMDDLTTVQNIGFRGVVYHSGEPFDSSSWVATRGNGFLTWSTTPHDQYPNANAIRWGTLYNFRFDAQSPPTPVDATLGLFKPGTPSQVSLAASGPQFAPCGPASCDDGVFCNGQETCDQSLCSLGTSPCPGIICREDSDTCQEPGDMYCVLANGSATPGSVVAMDVFLEGIGEEVRSYSSSLNITPVSGTGTVTVECPGGVEVDTSRPDYVFHALSSFPAPNCLSKRVSASLIMGGVYVGSEPVYLGRYFLTVSNDATEGSIFELEIVQPGSLTFVRDEANINVQFDVLSPCVLTVMNCNPCQPYGDIEPVGSGAFVGDCDVDVDDVLCALAAFSDPASCPAADLEPCGGDGDVDVDDLLAELDAFSGFAFCPAPCG